MKKLTALFLSLAMAVSLAACSNGSASNSSEAEPSSSEPSSNATESTETESTASGTGSGKTLVVYYSATGNTEAAAGYIAEITGGDLFKLEPADPYTNEDLNWTNEGSRVNAEHEDESLRNVELVQDTVDNWNEYDTIFIGYPIWWGIAAWPVNDFIQSNDFTGKTVIPFCTSSSSSLGESGDLLEEMAGTGNWLEGQRFRSSVSREDVQTWLNGLELS